MIEDDLRALLTDRAGTVAENPARVRAVHTRITGIRRRRSAGAALALVLVALAGLALTRLPGRPETLPTGSPGGPYFGDDGTSRSVDGYAGTSYFTFRGDAQWSVAATFPGVRHVLVARCAERGDLRLASRTGHGPELVLHCRVPVGGHYEGALPLDRTVYSHLVAAPVSEGGNVSVRPGSPGDWTVGMLDQHFPDHLTAGDLVGTLINGVAAPTGGRIPVTVPSQLASTRALFITLVCGRDVQLAVTVDGHPAGVATCDDAHVSGPGLVTYEVRDPALQQLGLRPGQLVSLGVRPVRPTDQWAVLSVS